MGAQQQLMELCLLNLDTLQPESPPDGEPSQDHTCMEHSSCLGTSSARLLALPAVHGVLAGKLLLARLSFAHAAFLLPVLLEYAFD